MNKSKNNFSQLNSSCYHTNQNKAHQLTNLKQLNNHLLQEDGTSQLLPYAMRQHKFTIIPCWTRIQKKYCANVIGNWNPFDNNTSLRSAYKSNHLSLSKNNTNLSRPKCFHRLLKFAKALKYKFLRILTSVEQINQWEITTRISRKVARKRLLSGKDQLKTRLVPHYK